MHEHQVWCFVLFIVIGVSAIALLFYADLKFTEEYQALQSVPEVKSSREATLVYIQIELGSEKRAFEGSAREGLTLRAALSEISELASLAMVLNSNGVAAIGTAKNNGKEWRVYKNDALLSSPLSYEFQGGERITLRYE